MVKKLLNDCQMWALEVSVSNCLPGMTVQTSMIWDVTGRQREMEQRWQKREECSRSDCRSLGRHGRRRYWVSFVWQPEVMTMTTGDDDSSCPRRAGSSPTSTAGLFQLVMKVTKKNC